MTAASHAGIPEEIFRAYDIRGIYSDTLTLDGVRLIGQAIGSEAAERGEQRLLVAADGRLSSPAVLAALVEGLTASGRDVIDLGAVPTPVLYFALAGTSPGSGVMVTASHNPPDHNGLKIALQGRNLAGEEIHDLWQRSRTGRFTTGSGQVTTADVVPRYLDEVASDIHIARRLKLVVDCGNGIAGGIAPGLFQRLGCEVVPLFCEVDGSFPNHPPDPLVPENLVALIAAVKAQSADLGIGIDGDGDRMIAVTGEGMIAWPDRLLMLFVQAILPEHPGARVVYDVKSSKYLADIISDLGGQPVMSRSGHSYLKLRMLEEDALIGGEMTGHLCFRDRWNGFDDGLYAAARLLEIVGAQSDNLDTLLAKLPFSVVTPEIHIPVAETEKFEIVDRLVAAADFADGKVTTIDGLRVDFADGWGLIRASNTNPVLTLRFEANSRSSLDIIQRRFRELVHRVDADLDFEGD